MEGHLHLIPARESSACGRSTSNRFKVDGRADSTDQPRPGHVRVEVRVLQVRGYRLTAPYRASRFPTVRSRPGAVRRGTASNPPVTKRLIRVPRCPDCVTHVGRSGSTSGLAARVTASGSACAFRHRSFPASRLPSSVSVTRIHWREDYGSGHLLFLSSIFHFSPS